MKKGDDIMDIRVLEYFLAIAREQNISAAARSIAYHSTNLITTNERAGNIFRKAALYSR